MNKGLLSIVPRLRPNRSLKRSANGRPQGPVWRYAVYFHQPVQERIQLVEVIWESIAAVPQALKVSPELKAELAARLVEFERNPEASYSWDQVKAYLKNGSWRTA